MTNVKKQELIYKSGIKLFGKFGPKKVSIDMIVQEAGVGKGTFYNHYKNKEELYETIIFDIMGEGEEVMKYLYSTVPDIKERFLQHMIGSLRFFEENLIIKNLINDNEDFYLGEITLDNLYEKHIKFMKLLIGKEFEDDEELVNIVINIKGFYTEVLNKQNHFKTREEYDTFVVQLAAVMINGIFSDYNGLIKGRRIADFGFICNKQLIKGKK